MPTARRPTLKTIPPVPRGEGRRLRFTKRSLMCGSGQNIIAGNHIGTDVTGRFAVPNTANGVLIRDGAQFNLIGTDGDGMHDAAERNVISGNHAAGVRVTDNAAGNHIRGNSIYSNGKLGIDLGGDGITPNDLGDADIGPNQLQNFPGIASFQTGSSTRVVGTLNSTPNMTFTLDFYANDELDPSGSGEGQRYLGWADVTTDGDGNVAFDVTLTAATTAGELITATASDPDGNTSEFSGRLATADAGGAYQVDEGSTVVLDGSQSSDPDQTSSSLDYQWDLDGDGVFGETGTDAERGDEVGQQPTFDATLVDGPAAIIVRLRVTDDTGLFDVDTATITVHNVAPQAAIAGPSAAVPGQPLEMPGNPVK